jgi:hypothetical protein
MVLIPVFAGWVFIHSKRDDSKISDHQQSWGYEDGPSKGPWSHGLLVIADL